MILRDPRAVEAAKQADLLERLDRGDDLHLEAAAEIRQLGLALSLERSLLDGGRDEDRW